jgi:hypothetical protein
MLRGDYGRNRFHRCLSGHRRARGRSAVPADPGLRRASSSSACPTRRSAKAASASARRLPRSACRFRPSESPSICRPPICPRKDRIMICRSRSGLLGAMGVVDAETLAVLCRRRRTWARRSDRRVAGRAARGDPRGQQRSGAGLPGRTRAGSRVGGLVEVVARPISWRCSIISAARLARAPGAR